MKRSLLISLGIAVTFIVGYVVFTRTSLGSSTESYSFYDATFGDESESVGVDSSRSSRVIQSGISALDAWVEKVIDETMKQRKQGRVPVLEQEKSKPPVVAKKVQPAPSAQQVAYHGMKTRESRGVQSFTDHVYGDELEMISDGSASPEVYQRAGLPIPSHSKQ